MFRRTRALVFVTCLAGCGTFLGLSGDDADDDDVSSSADVDGSADAGGDGGGDGGNTNSGGSGADSGTNKIDAAGAPDAAVDAKSDGNVSNDASSPTFRYVFVTGGTYPGSFGLGGGNPDTLCKTRADDFGVSALKGRSWRAWISTTGENAVANIGAQGKLPYLLADGITKVADDVADLTDGSLAHAIDRTEANVVLGDEPVWTGSNPAGMLITVNCSDWTAVAQSTNGKRGTTASAAGGWSESGDLSCTAQARLYCFEL